MDALQGARNYLEQYQHRINQDNYRGDLESRTRYENAAYQEGMLYAAIAQAEQLKRIADALDIMAHPNRLASPDPQDYYSEDEYNRAAERYDYHRNSRPGESMTEYHARREAREPFGRA
jgi:hypothetical protein